MQTRRDHVQAYRFAVARLSGALLAGDATARDAPLRRARLGLAFGVLVSVLIAAGVTVYGLLSPGGATSWRAPGTVVVERETGTRYLFLGGVLHPAVNYASAMLGAAATGGSAGSSQPAVQAVSAASLAGVPHGVPVGIVGAPESAPSATALLPGAVAACVAGGQASTVVDLDPAARPSRSLAPQRLVVTDPTGGSWVLWQGHRYRLPSRAAGLALGLGTQPSLPVTGAVLDLVPPGADLAVDPVPGTGRPVAAVAGAPTAVGQVLTTSVGRQPQFFVLRDDGLAPVGATEAALRAALPGASPRRAVSPADLASLPPSSVGSSVAALPDLLGAVDVPVSALTVGSRALCARQDPGRPAVVEAADLGTPDPAPVLVPPGRGLYATDGVTPARWLVTEAGVRHRVPDEAAETAMGLHGAVPAVLPAPLLARIPVGPDLDTGRATGPVLIVPAGTSAGGHP